MKPLRLELDGLNSFAKKQTIDFTELTKYGFFGIFGPTGSGKSTIVDAITLALYGEIPRFDGERGFGEFINNNKSSSYVCFEFEVSLGDTKKTYIVERSFKRTDNSIKTNEVRLIEISKNEKKILADKKTDTDNLIIQIIGLNYNDFTRTVVLPQGKFSEFLLLANKERRDMLERIFKLEDYGQLLSGRVRKHLGKINTKIQIIDSNLNIYGDITLEDIENNKKLHDEESSELIILRKKYNDFRNEDSELKTIKKNIDELNRFENDFQQLEEEKENILLLEIKLDKGKDANLIKPIAAKFYKNEEKIKSNITQLNEQNNKFSNNKKEKEDSSESYKEISKRMEENLPSLQEKFFKLKNAIEIQNDNINLSIEKKEANEKLTLLLDGKSSFDKQLESLKQMYENDMFKLNNIKKEKDSLNINSNFISGINDGNNLLGDYIEEIQYLIINLNKKNNSLMRLKSDNASLNNLSKTLGSNKENVYKIERQLSEFNTRKINIEESFYLQEEIKLKEILYNNFSISKNEHDENVENLIIVNKKIQKTKNNLNNINLASDEIGNKLDRLNEEIKKFEHECFIVEISKTLQDGDMCPICGSITHDISEKNLPKNTEDKIIEKRELETNYINYINLFEETNNELKIFENNKNNYNKTLVEMKNKIGDYNFVEEGLNNLKLKSDYENMKRTLSKQGKEKEVLELDLSKSKDSLANINTEIATIKESIRKENNLLNDIESIVKGSYKKYYHLKDKLNRISIELKFTENNFSKFIYWKRKIKENSVKTNSMNAEENKLLSSIDNLSELIEKAKIDIMSSDKNISEIKIAIKNLDKTIIENISKIKAISGKDIDPLNEIENVNYKIENLKKEEGFLKRRFEEKENEFQKIKTSIKTLENEEKLLKDISLELEIEIKEKLKESGFNDISNVLDSTITKEHESKLKNNIKLYYEKHTSLKDNINRLKISLDNKNISNLDDKIEKINTNINIINDLITEKTENIAVLKERNSKLEENYTEIEKLLLEKKSQSNDRDLLNDLANLFSGSRFVEFLSKKQLRYITREASERLKEMSNGRYALELKNTDFVIRDDYNGGIKRSPKTLSGGETFITSLCLSLALSSKVQLNSENPLEFFFLDEGFGTLDLESLDLVISSLEKLRDEKLIIGVISHSEELMARIPVKLMVEPGDQFGSGSTLKIDNIIL